jgi:hypothetical protein
MAKTKIGPTEQVIALLRKRPRSVPELVKATRASVVHVRSILYAIDAVPKKSLTTYSLPKGGRS